MIILHYELFFLCSKYMISIQGIIIHILNLYFQTSLHPILLFSFNFNFLLNLLFEKLGLIHIYIIYKGLIYFIFFFKFDICYKFIFKWLYITIFGKITKKIKFLNLIGKNLIIFGQYSEKFCKIRILKFYINIGYMK